MRKGLIALVVFMMTIETAWAGGILTNTNQSVLFLKNPARDAAIGLDGVYSNPAGVAFMPGDSMLPSTGSMPTRHVPSPLTVRCIS